MSGATESCLFSRGRLALIGAAGAGFAAFAAGLAFRPAQAWTAFLVSSFFFLTLSLGSLVFLAAMTVSNAGWHLPLKRVPESLAAYLPLGALASLALLAGIPWLYHWANPEAVAHDALLQAKAPYLNTGFFTMRTIGVLAAWVVFGMLMRHSFRRHDKAPGPRHSTRSVALSAVFLVVFPFSFSMAAIDWLMSLEPHWASTIFGLYNIAGTLSAAVAAISVVVILLRRRGGFPHIDESHFHDLGKLLFAFSTVWAYLWFCQYLLVWYSNLPEENTHYFTRLTGGIGVLFFLSFVLSWVVPFVLLLSRNGKQSEKTLLAASALVLTGRWLDIHLLVSPAVSQSYVGPTLLDLALLAGFAGAFLFAIDRALEKAPVIVPKESHVKWPHGHAAPVSANPVPAKESLYGS